ncbi:MAG: sulfur carrier protein ThiS [Chloroflexi bacterium]|nr:sulfur carrier protein ThiS [Chloroflexota bacterium]
MQVRINGKAAELPDNSTVKDLLLARRLAPDTVIIELNGEIVDRGKWEGLRLSPGDSLEIIRIMSGG